PHRRHRHHQRRPLGPTPQLLRPTTPHRHHHPAPTTGTDMTRAILEPWPHPVHCSPADCTSTCSGSSAPPVDSNPGVRNTHHLLTHPPVRPPLRFEMTKQHSPTRRHR